MAVQFKKPVDDDTPWEQRLVNYSSDHNAGKTEYQRALEVHRAKSALGDTAGADLAKSWADKVNTAMGGAATAKAVEQPNPYTDVLKQIQERVAKPVTPFSYDPQNDPQYQAALRTAQQNAQTGGNNAMVQMGARGIGNSSMTTDRVAQIQQSEMGRVSDTVLPQLMQQAYQRYLGDQQMEQQGINNLMNLGEGFNRIFQQDVDNQHRNEALREQQKQSNIGNAMQLSQLYGASVQPKESGQALFDQVAGMNTLAGRQFEQQQQQQALANAWQQAEQLGTVTQELSRLTGIPVGTPTMQARQMAQSHAHQQAQLGLSRERFEWDKAQAENKVGANNQELEGLYTGLSTGQIDPAAAIQEINERMRLGMTPVAEGAQMLSLVQQFAQSRPLSPAPVVTSEQAQQLGIPDYQNMNTAQMEKLWESDPTGKSAGKPKYDWAQWVRDPRGRQAGVSFEAWQQAYGPRLSAR